MSLRSRLAASRAARAAALPSRAAAAGRHLGSQLDRTSRWLITSKEHHNYTYDLSLRNLEHLAWWVSTVTGSPVEACRGWISEVLNDTALREHVRRAVENSDRRGLADSEIRLGRRAGWFAVVRALRPGHVVETGTDKGLGSLAIASALLRNGVGRLTTIDINPAAGYFLSEQYAEVTDLVVGDSVEALSGLGSDVAIFIHDSDHSAEHESRELRAVEPKLVTGARVLSDNAHSTDALVAWADSTDRRFLYFQEVPEHHWYPGAGIGAAW